MQSSQPNADKKKEMATVKGYRILNLPIHEDGNVFHQVYLKEHNDKRYQGRALFFGNVEVRPDIEADKIDRFLKALLSRFGEIDEISLSEASPDEARFAHVIFNKKGSLKVALTASDQDYLETWSETGKKLGLIQTAASLSKSEAQIRRMLAWKEVDYEKLKHEVDAFMMVFDDQEAQERQELKNASETPGEDGFVLVTSKNKRRLEDATNPATKRAHHQRTRKNKKNLELKNFYRFQIREEKMKQLDVLRQKFEEDKEKVARMKESRKFKPF